MADKMIRQTMFTTGEVDPITWKRTDIQEYLSAAQSLKNFEVGTTGLARKRKGTEKLYDATAQAVHNSRMYEFIDKFGNHYVVLSAAAKMYIFDVPTDSVDVVAGINGEFHVVTARGTQVVAHSSGFTHIQEVDTNYLISELDELDYAQDNDSIIFTHPDHAPSRLYIDSYDPLHFKFEVLTIYPKPAYDFGTINYNNFTVTYSISGDGQTLTFQFTGLGADPGFTDEWIDGQIIGGGASDTDPIGYAIIQTVGYDGGVVTFTARIQIPFKASGFSTIGSQYSIRQPAWSETLGYPAKCLYYQNRLWLANTRRLSNTVFGSKINAPINFDVGTGKDTDAIVYTIGINGSGAIKWMNGGKQLEIYCSNIECVCPQDQNSALTPSTFTVKQQSSYGASSLLKPITYLNDSYFTAKTGKSIINYRFTGVGLAYQSSNISAASQHLVKNPSNRALLRGTVDNQDNFVYFLNQSDDTLTAFQFADGTKLAALTPIEFQRDSDNDSIVELIDIVTIDNQIYILKYYTLSQKYQIERFNANYKVDCYRNTTMNSAGLVTGLTDLIGYSVQVIYDDQDFGEYLVNDDGEITVLNPNEDSGAVIVGLLYDVQLTPMYLFAGTSESPFLKNQNRIYVDYYESLDFAINGHLVPYQNFSDIQAGEGLVPQTDTAIVDVVDGWNRFGTLTITQSSPFDLQILGIAYQITSSVI